MTRYYRIKPEIAEKVRSGYNPTNWGCIPRSLVDIRAFELTGETPGGFSLNADECNRIGIESITSGGSWWISRDWVMPAICHKLDLI